MEVFEFHHSTKMFWEESFRLSSDVFGFTSNANANANVVMLTFLQAAVTGKYLRMEQNQEHVHVAIWEP